MSQKPKYPRYQDYIIRDGIFIGEFDQMYKDYDMPWHQKSEPERLDKLAILSAIKKFKRKNVLELGCGLGYFTQAIYKTGVCATGIDISKTAIAEAQKLHPNCNFIASDVLDFSIYENIKPDCIVMAEVTWYLMEDLDKLLAYLKRTSNILLLHSLTTYPPGVQKYGTDKFTCLKEILAYFDLEYEEFGEIFYKEDGTTRTFFSAFLK